MSTSPTLVATALAVLLLAGCQRPPPPNAASAEVRAECRQTVDRQYNAQNRADLTRRDERDYAFAGSYNTGIASRGLSAAFGRSQAIDDCLRTNGGPAGAAPGTGPVFAPEAAGGNASSLNP